LAIQFAALYSGKSNPEIAWGQNKKIRRNIKRASGATYISLDSKLTLNI